MIPPNCNLGWVGLAIVATMSGCAARQRPSPAISSLQERIAERGAVVFRSNDGVAHRMDNDTELVFRRNDVLMLLYRFGLSGCRGAYEFTDGRVVTHFKNCDEQLPPLRVEGQPDFLRLRSHKSGSDAQSLGAGNEWLFRMLSGSDEKGVMDTLREHKPPSE
jgi:hypothetical protein